MQQVNNFFYVQSTIEIGVGPICIVAFSRSSPDLWSKSDDFIPCGYFETGLDAVDGYSIFKLTQYEPNDLLEPEIRTVMMYWETFYDRHTVQQIQ